MTPKQRLKPEPQAKARRFSPFDVSHRPFHTRPRIKSLFPRLFSFFFSFSFSLLSANSILPVQAFSSPPLDSCPINMEGHFPHHLHHQQHLQQQQHRPPLQQQHISVSVEAGGDRFPQWSVQETKEFLMIRAELDRSFMETKRNKLLWEVISTRMREKGYNRSAEQCKCKWKNLVTRYKVRPRTRL